MRAFARRLIVLAVIVTTLSLLFGATVYPPMAQAAVAAPSQSGTRPPSTVHPEGHALPAVTAPKQTYSVISIKGEIGHDFTVAMMKAYLSKLDAVKPAMVVLELDTPGGAVDDADGIIDLLIERKDLHTVALVRKALSAGAAVALACKRIYVTEGARIGAAVSYTPGPDGLPAQLPSDVAEKFQSAWRAVCRKAAESGGHPALLAEAMTDPDFALTMRRDGGRLIFERDGTGELLKAKGRILTLTAGEAVSCELADGIAANPETLVQQLGMQEWQRFDCMAVALPSIPLYKTLADKATSLGLDLAPTGPKRTQTSKRWILWCKQQRFVGTAVKWNLSLVSVELKEAGIYYNLPFVQRTRWPGTRLMKGILWSHPCDLSPSRGHRGTAKDSAVVSAVSNARMFKVEAWADSRTKAQLASLPNGSPITVSGVIENLAPYVLADGRFMAVIVLDRCTVVLPETDFVTPKKGTDSVTPKKGTEGTGVNEKAASDLNLARAFRRNGLLDRAKDILEAIVKNYPDAPEAQLAQKELEEIQSETEMASPAAPEKPGEK